MLRHAQLLPILLMASACTIVQVRGANPSTSVHFGILKIEPAPGARSLSYRIRGIGLVPSTNGATLGYAQEDAVLAYHAEDCRIVVFEPPHRLPGQRDWYEQLNNLCQPGREQ